MTGGSADPVVSARRFALNNFDLIRLFAAGEVAIKHLLVHLELGAETLERFSILPGVPIFFFISGYLIFQSYRNSRRLGIFAANRVYRLFPGLLCCLAVGIILAIALGGLTADEMARSSFFLWLAAQATVAQFYNPEFLRDFGVGVLNGSLWTISVELQFYVLTPILAWLVLRARWLWAVGIAVSLAANLLLGALPAEATTTKLLMVTFLPWIYMYLAGAWLSGNQAIVDRIVRLPWIAVLAIFAAGIGVSMLIGLRYTGNNVGPIAFVGVSILIVKAAYSAPSLSDRILRRNDISYGLYIYHMIAVNAAVALGFIGEWRAFWIVLAATVVAAAISWFAIERPALALKRRSLRAMPAAHHAVPDAGSASR